MPTSLKEIVEELGEILGLVKTRTATGGSTSSLEDTYYQSTLLSEGELDNCWLRLTDGDDAGATATIALGVTGDTDLFIAATNAVDIDAGEFWVDDTPDANGVAVPAALKQIAITQNIIATIGAQNVDGGVLHFYCYWWPLSDDGNVQAA